MRVPNLSKSAELKPAAFSFNAFNCASDNNPTCVELRLPTSDWVKLEMASVFKNAMLAPSCVNCVVVNPAAPVPIALISAVLKLLKNWEVKLAA